eukprot:gene13960-biopygen10012
MPGGPRWGPASMIRRSFSSRLQGAHRGAPIPGGPRWGPRGGPGGPPISPIPGGPRWGPDSRGAPWGPGGAPRKAVVISKHSVGSASCLKLHGVESDKQTFENVTWVLAQRPGLWPDGRRHRPPR